MKMFIALLAISFSVAVQAGEQADKAKWLAETDKTSKATLKKVDQKWVVGCTMATTVYVSKNRKINDGTTPDFNAQNICALLSDDEQVKAHLKSGKDLKHQGCIDGIGMSMQIFDKSASNQKRKEVMIEYCL